MSREDLSYLRDVIARLPVGGCSYEQWLDVGIALKNEGGSCVEWEQWSAGDSRFKEGECARKWATFRGAARPIGVGTVVQISRELGQTPPKREREGMAMDWAQEITARGKRVTSGWTEELPPPLYKSPVVQLKNYIRAMFTDEECVGYVTEVSTEGAPMRGAYSQTAKELLEGLEKTSKLNNVIGDWREEIGAWIRINPLDGNGARDKNVTAFRHALVECDEISLEMQYSLIRELELPVTALVSSGGKSLHAIVKVDAQDAQEYAQRVELLYEVCRKNGLAVDRQNRNPSRLSRLPGVTRNGKQQSLLGINIGQPSWKDWMDFLAERNDELPEIENFAPVFDNLPPLAPELIEGVLRVGHKMLVAGPSKAGKSFLLTRLAIAIAEGQEWLGWKCRQGRVLYVNLEIDDATMFHRIADVYGEAGVQPRNVANLDVWNLRGRACPMDILAPKLIRRAVKKREQGAPYEAIVIDPIYKVLTGDENAADEMAKFCNQFDKIARDLGTSLIYCHHHSKGAQGQKRVSDRASGSGVFARDPDAMLDMIELKIDKMRREEFARRRLRERLEEALTQAGVKWEEWEEQGWSEFYIKACQTIGPTKCQEALERGSADARGVTGWRIESVLREFAPFQPVKVVFRYPCHYMDEWGLLEQSKAEGEVILEEDRRIRSA